MKERYKSFFQRLNALDTGNRAALRRSAGVMLGEADGNAVTAFFRVLPAWVPEEQTERWFAAACLRCLWDAGQESEAPLEKLIGYAMRSGELSDSMAHRVEVLMDTEWASDGFLLTKLTRLVKLLQRKTEMIPDVSQLLEDLLYWNGDKQTVQRRWARTIFTADEAETGKES